MTSWPDEPRLRDEIKELEEAGDRVTHDILHALPAATDTPIGRNDIHALAAALDDALDNTEEAADVLGLYKIEAPMEQGLELTRVLRACGREVADALVALFAGGIDPMVVIRWKDVFERLEQAIDACDRVGHILEGLTVNYG